jgi:hypothetical protein
MATVTAKVKTKKRTKQFLEDSQGQRAWVVLPIEEYDELVEAAEQRVDIRRLEAGKKLKGKDISLEEFEAKLCAERRLSQ